jgi:hypothetical protein
MHDAGSQGFAQRLVDELEDFGIASDNSRDQRALRTTSAGVNDLLRSFVDYDEVGIFEDDVDRHGIISADYPIVIFR